MNAAAMKNPELAPRKQVRVNGVTIPHHVIAQEAQNHGAKNPAEAFAAAAQALAVRELLLEEARRRELVAAPLADDQGRRETEEDALIRALIESQAPAVPPDEEACRHYYENNEQRFRSADLFEAAHILVAAAHDDDEAARAAAVRLIEALRAAPQDFFAAARAASACPSRENGGALGQFARGQCVPEFEEALDAMAPGEIYPEPVWTSHGFHVIRLDRKIEGATLPFEMVKERIAEYLAEARRRRAIASFIAHLAEDAEIEGVRFAPGTTKSGGAP